MLTRLKIALASCQYPADLLDRKPLLAKRGPADASKIALAEMLRARKSVPDDPPEVFILAGDQVYLDATAGLFDPAVLDDRFHIAYANAIGSAGQQLLMRAGSMTVYTLFDDHEVADNWDLGQPRLPIPKAPLIDLAKDAFWVNQRAEKLPVSRPLWRFDVNHQGVPFFLADTRTERDARSVANHNTRVIMSTDQKDALEKWLTDSKNAEKPKFIATSSAMLPRQLHVRDDELSALHSDAWDGYPKSLHELLAFICENQIKGVVFLSGDAHISFFTSATIENCKTKKAVSIRSVHSSALYAPYPFANAIADDFAGDESFQFTLPAASAMSAGETYKVSVNTLFTNPGDGFVLLTTEETYCGKWTLEIKFHDADGIKKLNPSVQNLF